MATGSGLGQQIGMVAEGSYGVYSAPSRFVQATAKMRENKTTAQGRSPAASRLLPLASRRVVTTRDASGSIDLEVVNRGMGLLLQTLMGTTVTPVQQGGTTAYLQTHTLADPFGKSLTIQAGVPDAGGTVRPFTYLGCKVTAAEFTFEIDKEVTATFDIDSRQMTEAQGLVAASYPTGTRPFVGTDTSVKIGASFGGEAAVTGITKATCKIERPMKTDRNYLGAAGRKAEPILAGDYAKITGVLSSDFVDKTILADRFAADTRFYLVLEAVGSLISGAFSDTLRITLPACFLDNGTPMADSLDVVSGDFPYVVTFDETNLPKIEYISADTTL